MLKTTFKYLKNSTNNLRYNLLGNKLLYSQVCKFVSGNPQSKVNRENREMEKIDKFWANIDDAEAKKRDLAKQIEEKYGEETLYLGRHIKAGEEIDPLVEEKLVDLYYIPLTLNDKSLLDNFSKEIAEMIFKGGRLLLHNEIKNYNKSQTIENQLQITPPFEPLSASEIKEIQDNFYELYENEKVFNFILQQGKACLEEIKSLKEEKVEVYLEYLSKLSYVDHYSEVLKSVPFNTNIATDFQKYEDPAYVKFYLTDKKLDEAKLTQQLKDIYFNFYKETVNSLQNLKEEISNEKKESSEPVGLEKIKDQIEPCLYDRINAFVDYLFYNKLNFDFKKPDDGSKLSEEKYYIFEKLFFKGVCLNRYENSEPEEYVLIDTHEDLGIRYYLHKYLMGEANKIHNKNPLTPISEYQTKDFHNSLTFQVKERNRKIILRTYLFLKHPYVVEMTKSSSPDLNLVEYPSQYSHNHLAVFENELEAPNHTYLINNNFERWLLKHSLNPKKWKLVDVDNFMKGNPFFLKKSTFQGTFENILNDDEYAVDFLAEKFPEIKNPESFSLNISFNTGNAGANSTAPQKKERKKKDSKESKTTTNTPIEEARINSLEFDYKITKIKRPVEEDFVQTDKEDLLKIKKIEKELIQKESLKIEKSIELEFTKEEEMGLAIENGLNSHEKLEQLVKLYTESKKEKLSIDSLPINEVEIDPFKENKGRGQYKSELERLVNKLMAKRIQRWIEKKGEFI